MEHSFALAAVGRSVSAAEQWHSSICAEEIPLIFSSGAHYLKVLETDPLFFLLLPWPGSEFAPMFNSSLADCLGLDWSVNCGRGYACSFYSVGGLAGR